ncbi:MAG TPA: AAA family ATPase [Pirellulales bacterium]|nr:AAA family ATPase [Pirellulales bacterium]
MDLLDLTAEESFSPLPTDAAPMGTTARQVCAAARTLRDTPFDIEIRRYFGGTKRDLLIKRQAYPMYDLPQLHQALAACFADWQLTAEGGSIDARPGALWAPKTARMLVAPGRWVDYEVETTRFYRLPDGGRRVLAIEEFGHDGFRIHFIGPRSQADELTTQFDALARRMTGPHYLQNQVLKSGGDVLEGFEPASWDDVALEPAVRAAIDQNTVEVFRRREAFRRNGVPLKRGVLIYGPPGTGKTLLAKALAGQKLATFIYVTAADVFEPDGVRGVFALARKLNPSIVFFEDIDLFADERSAYCSKAVLGETLAQLDGFEKTTTAWSSWPRPTTWRRSTPRSASGQAASTSCWASAFPRVRRVGQSSPGTCRLGARVTRCSTRRRRPPTACRAPRCARSRIWPCSGPSSATPATRKGA